MNNNFIEVKQFLELDNHNFLQALWQVTCKIAEEE